jgi:hypothetical protein
MSQSALTTCAGADFTHLDINAPILQAIIPAYQAAQREGRWVAEAVQTDSRSQYS